MLKILSNYRVKIKRTLALVFLTLIVGPAAYGQEEPIQSKVTAYGPQPTEEELLADPSKLSFKMSLGYRSKAQYFDEPQQSYSLRGRLSYFFQKSHLFSIDQGIAYREFPYEELYTSDTSFGYSYVESLIPFSESSGLKLTPSVGVELGTSKQSSAYDHRYGIINGTLNLGWQAFPWLEVGTNIGADVFFYKDTLSIFGEATEKYSGSVGFYASASYDHLSLSQSYSFNQTALNADWDDIYTFTAATNLSVSLPSDFTLSAGFVTSDNQLRYGRNRNFEMYDKDITRFSFTVSKKFF